MTEMQMLAVIDDDVSIRESLPDLLGQLGYAATAFGSAQELLSSDRLADFHCLIIDIAMPDMSGPELHRELLRQGRTVPVIFITAHVDKSVGSMPRQQRAVAILVRRILFQRSAL